MLARYFSAHYPYSAEFGMHENCALGTNWHFYPLCLFFSLLQPAINWAMIFMSSGRGLKIRENARSPFVALSFSLSFSGLYNYYIQQQQQQQQRRLYCARVCKDYYGERLIGVNRAGCCVLSFPSDRPHPFFKPGQQTFSQVLCL
jgi:hypothetical protein